MISAISLPNVDGILAQVADRVDRTVAASKQLAQGVLERLSQPYRGHLDDQQVMYAMPAAGRAYAEPGVLLKQTADDERAFSRKRARDNRAAFFSKSARGLASSRGPQKKGLTGSAVMDWGESTFTCSNHVEEAGSSSLTDSSNWMVWADDFEHEGF